MLNDTALRAAPARDKAYKLSDAEGLYLLVKPNGARLWQMAYRFHGKQKTLSIGPYPTIGLSDAREARGRARKMLLGGEDPSLKKRLDKITQGNAAAATFSKVADDFVERRKADGAAPRTIKKHRWLLKQATPQLGHRPIADITAPEVFDVLKRIERSGRLETAREVRSICSRVFRHAIVTARATQDPCIALIGATVAPTVTHHAAILDPAEVGGLMRAIRSYSGGASTRNALKLLSLTFVRSSELRFATWAEFDLDGKKWSIPAKRMKMPRPHIVPLARQTLLLLRDMKKDAHGDLLFPGLRSFRRPISDNTINAALRRMGFAVHEMTGHGFRTTASTILNENGFNPDWIERQLAHKDKNKTRSAYNAAEFLPGRATMMQWWADWLDQLADPEEDLIG